MTGLSVIQADITTLEVDAIVNAANEDLAPGSGVNGAIMRAAGPLIAAAMRKIGYCPTGEAVLTRGYDLPARFVIHTVAPIWNERPEPDTWNLLAACYRNSLALAARNDLTSIAFPALGTGIYGLPFGRATEVAISAVTDYLSTGLPPMQVMFCCFTDPDARACRSILAALAR